MRTQDLEGLKDDAGRPLEQIVPPRGPADLHAAGQKRQYPRAHQSSQQRPRESAALKQARARAVPADAAGETNKDPDVWEPPEQLPAPSSDRSRLRPPPSRNERLREKEEARRRSATRSREDEAKRRTAAAAAVRKAAATRPAAATKADGDQEFKTINPQRVYVGDRAKIKGTPRAGEVMYVGPAQFAHGATVVGLRLVHKRTTSMCDGKYHGERYFRCQPGYGQYVPLDDVEVMDTDPLYEEPAPESGRSRSSSSDVDPGSGSNYRLEKDLRSVVGLSKAKEALVSIRNSVAVARKRANVGVQVESMHAVNVFLGNPGTGKTSIAHVLGRLLHSLGELESDSVLEVERKDLTSSGYHEEDDPCVDVIRRARGGILLVKDAHTLMNDEKMRDSSGMKAIHTLARECESGRNQVVLVLDGPRAEMEKFLKGPGAALGRLVTKVLEFPDFSAEECVEVARIVAAQKGFQLGAGVDEPLADSFRLQLRRADAQSSNSRCVHAVLNEAIRNQTDRIHQKGTIGKSSLTTLEEVDFGTPRDSQGGGGDGVETALAKLDGVTGLPGVKDFVHSMVATLDLDRQRRDAGLKPLSDSSLHMIFAGNPGTGKTTIARVVADILRSLGVLRVGHLVEADRSSLVAGYVGQTAIKTHAVVQSALGGVLFIDEAYSLVSDAKDTFGREALDTLIKLVEDYRDDLVVILAGYKDEMNVLLSHNPGVRSRFPTVIEFANYSSDELMEIFQSMIKNDDLVLDGEAEGALAERFRRMGMVEDKENGNGRAVRNVIEQAKRRQALRLQSVKGRKSADQLRLLTAADLEV